MSTLPAVEQRFIEWSEIEVDEQRSEDSEPAKRTISGYAAMFNKLSLDLGGFREQIQPGAFEESVKKDIVALWSHNTDIVLGRSSNGSLELSEDSRGLKFKLSLDTDHWGEYAFKKIQRKDVQGMSFGFRIPPDGASWDIDEKKGYIRTLKKVLLHEISPTVFPAYPATSVAVRSIEDVLNSAPKIFVPRNLQIEKRRLRLLEAC